jgi:hypothetical protein
MADPAELANQKILADRARRLEEKALAEDVDLGLDIDQPPPESASELLRDEWDKKAFGEPPKTTTRVIYGPDPLISNCPEFKERIEKYGQQELAGVYAEVIMTKGEMALSDPFLRRGLKKAIEHFGKEATAKAFYDRVMRIPARTVEIELDGALDPLISNPMEEVVRRYGEAGFAYKFLSEGAIKYRSMRGYEIVKDENGDPIKVGTLMMGRIPQDWAERRRRKFAEDSEAKLREQEDQFTDAAARASHDGRALGIAPLSRGESVRADYVDTGVDARGNPSDPALEGLYGGQTRTTGIHFQRQG